MKMLCVVKRNEAILLTREIKRIITEDLKKETEISENAPVDLVFIIVAAEILRFADKFV